MRRRSRPIRPPKRLRFVVENVDSRVYDLEAAKGAQAVISKLDKKSLFKQGTITTLPYPGIGEAPARPGGEIQFLGRAQLGSVFNASRELRRRLLVVGPKGIGKSCMLRAYACCMIQERDAVPKLRVVCIWNMEAALRNLLQTMKNALLFTYCLEDALLQQEILGLTSVDAVVGFLKRRKTDGEIFYFIVDGAEIVDTQTPYGYVVGDSKERHNLKQELDKVVILGRVVYGISPRADMLRQYANKDPDTEVLLMEQGFYGEELEQYMAKLSVLGALCSKFPERYAAVEFYAGDHPLSLVVLDRCCRMQALSKVEQEEDEFSGVSYHDLGKQEEIHDNKVVELLEDEEDWDAALKRFTSAGEIANIRVTTQELLKTLKLEGDCHRVEDMTKYDRRFVIGNALEGEVEEYCTSYIWRIYTEEFRAMFNSTEHGTCF